MKLIASLIVRNEHDRYLDVCLSSLNEFCDEIRVVDDGSTDGTHACLVEHGCVIDRDFRSRFYEHEGRARQRLLDFTLQGQPTHILAIDADEIIGDGPAMRRQVEQTPSRSGAWSLWMTEVWKADERAIQERVDGAWGQRKVPIVFQPMRNMKIADRALASGREPQAVAKAAIRGQAPVVGEVFHLGWACQSDRANRYHRYEVHDGGEFHASQHLLSIMWPDAQVSFREHPWPPGMLPFKDRLVERINR